MVVGVIIVGTVTVALLVGASRDFFLLHRSPSWIEWVFKGGFFSEERVYWGWVNLILIM